MVPATDRVPLRVEPIIAASIESFLAAASLHLGGATPAGETLQSPDADEAWRSLLAAHALIRRLDGLVHDDFKAALAELADRLAARYPQREFPLPEGLIS